MGRKCLWSLPMLLWTELLPPNSYVEALTHGMAFRDGAFGTEEVMRVEPSGVGSALSEEGQGRACSSLSIACGKQEEGSPGPDHTGTPWSWTSGLHHREKCMSVL